MACCRTRFDSSLLQSPNCSCFQKNSQSLDRTKPPSFLGSEPSPFYVRRTRISSARMRLVSRPLTSGRSKVKRIESNIKLCPNKARLTCAGNTTCEKNCGNKSLEKLILKDRWQATHSTNMIGVPTFLLRALKASVEMMVPAFPALAKMSWAVARKRVGNTYLKGKRVNSVNTREKETRTHFRRGNTG